MECSADGPATLPDVGVQFLPSGFCETCSEVWFAVGCLGNCEECELANNLEIVYGVRFRIEASEFVVEGASP